MSLVLEAVSSAFETILVPFCQRRRGWERYIETQPPHRKHCSNSLMPPFSLVLCSSATAETGGDTPHPPCRCSGRRHAVPCSPAEGRRRWCGQPSKADVLHVAIEGGSTSSAEALLEAGANPKPSPWPRRRYRVLATLYCCCGCGDDKGACEARRGGEWGAWCHRFHGASLGRATR